MINDVCSYVESNGSFSVLIQLLKTKKTRYISLLPTIVFANKEEQIIKETKKLLNTDKDIIAYKQKNRKNTVYKLVFQGVDECNHVLDMIDHCKFTFESRKEVINLFAIITKKIYHAGEYHRVWNDKIKEIILLKREINDSKRTRPGYTASEWEKRIKKHFLEVKNE